MLITVDQIMNFCPAPCAEYPRERVAELIGDGKTPLEILDLDIPIQDRFWVLFREAIIPARELRLMATYAASYDASRDASDAAYASYAAASAAARDAAYAVYATYAVRDAQIEIVRGYLRKIEETEHA